MIFCIIIVIVFFPIVLATETGNGNESEEYYGFTAKWNKGDTTEKITTETGETQTVSINAYFRGAHVFKNLVILAKDITEDTTLPMANMSFSNMEDTKNTGSRLVFTKTVSGGNSYSGSLSLFPRLLPHYYK